MNKRRVELDAMRIVAILFVITIHVVMPYIDYPPFFATNTWWIISLLNAFSRVAVPMFIMISGTLVLMKKEDARAFFKKRMTRIILPLLFWSGVYFAWRRIFWGHYIPWDKMGQDLWEGTTTYHLYFLYIIAGLYAITPLLRRYALNISKISKKWLTVVFFALGMGLQFIDFNFFPIFKIGIILFLPYIGYYYAGHQFEKISLKKSKVAIFFVCYSLLAIITAYLNFQNMKLVGWSNTSMNVTLARYFLENLSINIILMSCVAYIFFLNFFKSIKFKKSVSERITSISFFVFGVYLVHPIVIDVINRFTKLGVGVLGHFVLITILFKIVLTAALSFLIVIVIKKLPKSKYIIG